MTDISTLCYFLKNSVWFLKIVLAFVLDMFFSTYLILQWLEVFLPLPQKDDRLVPLLQKVLVSRKLVYFVACTPPAFNPGSISLRDGKYTLTKLQSQTSWGWAYDRACKFYWIWCKKAVNLMAQTHLPPW